MLLLLVFASLFSLRVASGEIEQQVKAVTVPVVHGEGPFWDSERQVLYFVDIAGQTVNRFDPKTKEHSRVFIEGGPVSLVIPVKFEDEFIIGRGLDIIRVRWDGKSSEASELRVLTSVDADKPRNRFNDGKVDASGRLWAGTMGPEDPEILLDQGSLYSFEPVSNFKPVKQLSPVSISNGLSWSFNDSLMYYIDSPSRNVDVFDFDVNEGTISNRRTLFSFEKNEVEGVPDGMALDENDNLWVAAHDGAAVLHIDCSSGRLLRKVHFPTRKITSCAFGGPDLETLFVTSSRVGLSDEQLTKDTTAGSVFQISNLGVKGQLKSNKIQVFSSGKSQDAQ